MKSQSKVFNTVSFALIALGLAACGSSSTPNPPTLAGTAATGTTCGTTLQAGYVYTAQGELPQGSCPAGYGQVGQYIGQQSCLPAIQNGYENGVNCNGINGQGIAPGPYGCQAGTILQNGLCYPQGINGGYPGMIPGQYPGVGIGGGGTFGYPYGQNGMVVGGVYNTGVQCLPGYVFNGMGCVFL